MFFNENVNQDFTILIIRPSSLVSTSSPTCIIRFITLANYRTVNSILEDCFTKSIEKCSIICWGATNVWKRLENKFLWLMLKLDLVVLADISISVQLSSFITNGKVQKYCYSKVNLLIDNDGVRKGLNKITLNYFQSFESNNQNMIKYFWTATRMKYYISFHLSEF